LSSTSIPANFLREVALFILELTFTYNNKLLLIYINLALRKLLVEYICIFKENIRDFNKFIKNFISTFKLLYSPFLTLEKSRQITTFPLLVCLISLCNNRSVNSIISNINKRRDMFEKRRR
jgi:hypothetical protein